MACKRPEAADWTRAWAMLILTTHMPESTKPVVTKEDDVWVIRLQTEAGKQQEYRCACESQARQLALVLTPKEKK